MKIVPDQYLLSVELKDSVARNPKEYPFCIPAIASIEKIEFHPKITFLVGENGSGKSTLLEALAVHCGFGEEGGTKNVRVTTADTVSALKSHLRVAKGPTKPKDGYFLRAESFYNIATYMDQVGYLQSYGGKSLHEQSHGESFLALLTKKFRGNGMYFLDEPEAALSPKRQLAAIVAIGELIEKRSQFVVATHSPILLAYPDAEILYFDEKGIRPIAYEDTEHYKITRQFLNDYKRHVNYLLRRDLPLE